MRVKFQADADLNQDIVKGVRRRIPEIDFQTAEAAGLEGLDDQEVLAIAADEYRILVSHDRRTMAHHFGDFISGRDCPGVFLISKRTGVREAIDEIVLVWPASGAVEYLNQIVTIPL